MRQKIAALKLNGSFLVIHQGKVLLDEAKKNTTDTSYLINSVQKSMTAAMVMQLVQEGKLNLQDRLSKFYPAVPGAKKVRVHNLLAMTAGLELKPGTQLGQSVFHSDQKNLASDIEKTIFKPDMLNQWYYSSLNYVYLCGIISQVTGKSYEQAFRETYVEPLKLQHTEFLWSRPERLLDAHLVPGEVYHQNRYQLVKPQKALQDAHNELGAGSIVMSNHDLARVVHYLLVGPLLSAKSRQQLYQVKAPAFYNGGFYIDKRAKTKIANGAGAGYYTFLRTTDDAKTMIIIQTNQTKSGQFNILKSQIDQLMTQLLD